MSDACGQYRSASSNVDAPKTTVSISAQMLADMHMGHGSQVLYRMHPRSDSDRSFFVASRMALISAWFVGSRASMTVS